MKYLNSGIYCIVNLVNNKRYIGQAVDLKRREYEHFFAKKRTNPLLRNSIKKYGLQNFVFIILEYLPANKEILTNAEQKWLDFYKDKWDRLYNLCPIAETTLGLKATEEAKQNISKALKGKKKSPEYIEKLKIRMQNSTYQIKQLEKATELKKRAVNQINIDTGEILNTFPSIKDAAIYMKAPTPHNIGQVARGYQSTAYGYRWEFADNTTVPKEKINCKKVIMCDLEWNELRNFSSLREAARFLNKKGGATNISQYLKNNYEQCFGYKWKFINK
ncbi:MAG: hypothetical protein EKK57_07555 [Proteobacteria bacterium]|nr:MAG: hypothetical protein EKK57_07555 [Pseudomonadota bacterium]